MAFEGGADIRAWIPARDGREGYVTRIGILARIVGMSPDFALTAAKLEAHISDKASEPEKDRTEKQRRKWDCFHIA